jgi:hypothetical protein
LEKSNTFSTGGTVLNIGSIFQLGAVTKALGGSNAAEDGCNGVSVDRVGNVFCSGWTMGETNGDGIRSDAFIMKLDSSGILN